MLALAQGGAARDLALDITSIPNPAPPSTPITYNLTVTNRGPGQAGGLALATPFRRAAPVQPITPPSGWTCTQTASTVDCPYGAVVPPGAPTVRITVLPCRCHHRQQQRNGDLPAGPPTPTPPTTPRPTTRRRQLPTRRSAGVASIARRTRR